MKIEAPNYTQSPNVLFDEIFKTLKEGELRIVLVLIRQTFGWHKEWDQISIRMLADKTGMERKSVQRSIKTLIENGLVEEKRFGKNGHERLYFRLVMEEMEMEKFDDDEITEEEIEMLSNNSYPRPKIQQPASQKIYTGVPTTPTKETNQKKIKIDSDSSPLEAAHRVENKIKIDIINQKPLFVGIEDLMTMFIQHRQETTKEEIDELFRKLQDYKDPIRDFYTFCDTIIKNNKKSKISKEIKLKESKCQQTTQNQKNNTTNTNKKPLIEKSKTTNDVTLTKNTSERPLANWRSLLGLPERYTTT